jgi:hypothetical protein
MKLSRIALFSLLSVIPLYANDHDIAEPIANDMMTVQPEDVMIEETQAKERDTAILDGKEDVTSIGIQTNIIDDDAENDVVVDSSLPSKKQAQHEEKEVMNSIITNGDDDDEKDRVQNGSQQTDMHKVQENGEPSDDTNMLKKDSLETSNSLENEVILQDDSNTDSHITQQSENSSSSSSLKDVDDTNNNHVQDVEETNDNNEKQGSVPISDSIPDNKVQDEQQPSSNNNSNRTDSEKVPEQIDHGVNAVDNVSNEEEEKSKPVEVDYANKSTGAQIVDKSKKFQGTSNLLVNDKDKYAMIECDAGEGAKYVIIGLSEEILVKSIKLSSYERYSSLTKKFQVLGSQTYPVMTEWEDLGTFDAKPWYKENKEQTFEPTQPGWARYLKFRFLEHYGNEHYCSYTQIKVHGSTTLQGFHEMQLERNEAAAEAAKAVVDEIENVSFANSEKRDSDGTVGSVDDEEEEKEEEVSSNTHDNLEIHEARDTEDERVATTSNEDKIQSQENEKQSPNATSTTNVLDEKPGESVEVEVSQKKSSPLQDLNSGARANADSEPILKDMADDEKKNVSVDTADVTDSLQESSDGEVLESDEAQHSTAGKTEKVVKVEDGAVDANHVQEMENLTVKASTSGKNTADSHYSEEASQGTPEPPSSPSVSNAVTSAIKSVKNGSLMKDAVQGINKIIHSNAETKNHPEGAPDNKAGPPVEQSSDYKGNHADEINNEKLTSSDSIVNSKDIKNTEHITVDPLEQDEVDASVQSALATQGMATKMNSNNGTHKTNVNISRDDLLAAQEMVQMLSVRFPNAKCLDYLDFAEFKRRTLDAVNQKGSSAGEKPKGTVQKNEPIFKKLTDEIKGLQASQTVYEQYIKAATSCYQRVILDLGNEVIIKQKEQDRRMKSLEDEIIKLKEQGLHHRLSTEDLLASFYSLFESLSTLVVKTCPSLYSRCKYLISFIILVMERIMADERVKKIISIAVAHKRDGCIFGLGVLFSYLFLNFSMNFTKTGHNKRKDKTKRDKARQHRSKNKEDIIVNLHNAPSLHSEEGSY